MMVTEKTKKTIIHQKYLTIIIILLANLIFLRIIGIYEEQIYRIMNIDNFLTAHIVLEFFGVLVAFMISVITYYTYNKNNRMRLLVYGSTFFIVGFLSFFHTMSYDGMPVFFTASSAPKATNFWIITRIIMAIGLFIAGIIPVNKKTNVRREYFLVGSIIITITIGYITIFREQWIPPMFIDGEGLTPLKVYLEYTVMLIFSGTMLMYVRDYTKTEDMVFFNYALGSCFAIITDGAFTLYMSVYDIYNFLGHIFLILSYVLIFRSIFVYNLDKPYNQLNKAQKRIKQYADNLEQLVEKGTEEIKAANEKMMEDLEYAKGIQQSLLPPKCLNILGTKFISEFIPCEDLSGDFYNIHVVDENHISMYIGDVAGHGVSAAMMTVFADRIMQTPDLNFRGKKAISPSKRLKNLYEEFNKSNFPSEMHIVIFEGIYNIKNQVLSYCSGGMNVLPILVKKNGDTELLDKSVGFPICKFGDFYSPKYENAYIKLNKGDRIVFYTDGLVDNVKENTLISKEIFMNILMENLNEPLSTLNNRILLEIQKINKSDIGNDDDITYFILEV